MSPEAFFGEATAEWRAAINALHAFAQSTRCPAGGNVFDWIASRTDAFTEVNREEAQREAVGPFRRICARRNHASPGPGMPTTSGSHVPAGLDLTTPGLNRFECEP
jgi:hypothetical protein